MWKAFMANTVNDCSRYLPITGAHYPAYYK